MAASFNGLFKRELIYRQGPWRRLDDVEFATMTYVDWFEPPALPRHHNRRPGYTTPAAHEVDYNRESTPAPEPVTQQPERSSNPGCFSSRSGRCRRRRRRRRTRRVAEHQGHGRAFREQGEDLSNHSTRPLVGGELDSALRWGASLVRPASTPSHQLPLRLRWRPHERSRRRHASFHATTEGGCAGAASGADEAGFSGHAPSASTTPNSPAAAVAAARTPRCRRRLGPERELAACSATSAAAPRVSPTPVRATKLSAVRITIAAATTMLNDVRRQDSSVRSRASPGSRCVTKERRRATGAPRWRGRLPEPPTRATGEWSTAAADRRSGSPVHSAASAES